MGRYNIPVRVKILGITQVSLKSEVEKRLGRTIQPAQFSNYVNDRCRGYVGEEILKVADQILTEWENK